MIRSYASVPVLVVSLALAACGGGSSGGSSSPPPPPPSNPCTTALAAGDIPELTGLEHLPPQTTGKQSPIDGDPRGRALAAQWIHREAQLRAAGTPRADATAPAPAHPAAALDGDQGNIAVLQDQGDMILSANTFDLQSTGIRFSPSGSGYSVAKVDAAFRTTLGRQVTLGDDDSVAVDVPFSFPLYGSSHTAAFINSDGNITFEEGDNASTDRSIQRVLTGPPRVSPFFSDLDPSTGGKIFVNAASDQYTVTWCGVRAFGSTRTVTAQVTLLRDGSIEARFDSTTNVTDAIVAVSPGGSVATFTPVDLSKAPVSGDGAVGERFSGSAQVDSIAIGRRFFAAHPDNYDQIVVFADQRIIPPSEGAFAYSVPVSNSIRGIGLPQYNFTSDYGSGAARLRTVMIMDALAKYNENQTQKINGEFTSLAIIAHECGHQWLAYVQVRDHTGTVTNALLTSDLAHWNFFDDTNASFMYGHSWQDLGGGSFRSVEAAQRFSRLDQYLMGLIPPSVVQAFFYIEGGTGATTSDLPRVGATTTGTRRDVLVNDVIAAEGDRNPNAAGAPHSVRQAWIFIISRTATGVDASQVAKLDNLRQQFIPFMSQATEGRMAAVNALR